MRQQKINLGITCGDINGIGIEIVIKAFQDSALFDLCTPILYVPLSVFDFYKQLFDNGNLIYRSIQNSFEASPCQLNIVSFSQENVKLNPGISTGVASTIALQSIDLAIHDFKKKNIDVIVTLPVNKKNISMTCEKFVGHTEYFSAAFSDTPNIMLLCNNSFKIATLTNHIPISRVSSKVTKSLVREKINLLIDVCQKDFVIKKPKIALLSLNPHAGDEGLIGKEEDEVISPVVKEFTCANKFIYGPFSADAFFGTQSYKKYDAVLALYHDQALIPFKALSFGSGVNYTAGLPAIRVSPDHGVAYDIAGKGLASASSLSASIYLAIKIHHNRLLN